MFSIPYREFKKHTEKSPSNCYKVMYYCSLVTNENLKSFFFTCMQIFFLPMVTPPIKN